MYNKFLKRICREPLCEILYCLKKEITIKKRERGPESLGCDSDFPKVWGEPLGCIHIVFDRVGSN
jgi:hypothetical protein